jgi:ABC-type Fe3+ transport system permease subunit
MELSNQLKTYMPLDFAASGLFLLLSLWAAPFWVSLFVGLPLAAFNVRSFLRRDHKQYFITRKEYQSAFKKMENQFKCKSVYYGVLTAGSLVMMILALIDFMERLV